MAFGSAADGLAHRFHRPLFLTVIIVGLVSCNHFIRLDFSCELTLNELCCRFQSLIGLPCLLVLDSEQALSSLLVAFSNYNMLYPACGLIGFFYGEAPLREEQCDQLLVS